MTEPATTEPAPTETPKPKRAEQWEFKVPIYGVCVLLVRSNPESYVRVLKRYVPDANKKDEPCGVGRSIYLVSQGKAPVAVIWIADHAKTYDPWWLNVLAHECWHTTYNICKDLGMKPCAETEEAYAYLHGWLIQACVWRLVRKPTRKRGTVGT